MNQQTLMENVNNGKLVREIMDWIDHEFGTLTIKQWTRMVEQIQGQHLPPVEPDPDDQPMEEREAILFEDATMPYGAYAGDKISELPREYLAKVLDPSQFNKLLKRYVRSRRFQERTE